MFSAADEDPELLAELEALTEDAPEEWATVDGDREPADAGPPARAPRPPPAETFPVRQEMPTVPRAAALSLGDVFAQPKQPSEKMPAA